MKVPTGDAPPRIDHEPLWLPWFQLDNAVRHTTASGDIRIVVHTRDDSIDAAVADTGEGIESEHLTHLGKRFYRVDAARARMDGGTGPGLAI